MTANSPLYQLSPEHLNALAEKTWLDIRRAAIPQVEALLVAGWRFELPDSPDPEPWQWYWRRPPRRKRSKGMLFRSTQQAHNALIRETVTAPPCPPPA